MAEEAPKGTIPDTSGTNGLLDGSMGNILTHSCGTINNPTITPRNMRAGELYVVVVNEGSITVADVTIPGMLPANRVEVGDPVGAGNITVIILLVALSPTVALLLATSYPS